MGLKGARLFVLKRGEYQNPSRCISYCKSAHVNFINNLVIYFFLTCVAALTGLWHQTGRNSTLFTNILDTIDAESVARCGVTCFHMSGCRGFDFSREEECVLHDAVMAHPISQSINRGDEMYQNFGKVYISSLYKKIHKTVVLSRREVHVIFLSAGYSG